MCSCPTVSSSFDGSEVSATAVAAASGVITNADKTNILISIIEIINFIVFIYYTSPFINSIINSKTIYCVSQYFMKIMLDRADIL